MISAHSKKWQTVTLMFLDDGTICLAQGEDKFFMDQEQWLKISTASNDAEKNQSNLCKECGSSLSSGTTPKDGKTYCPTCGAVQLETPGFLIKSWADFPPVRSNMGKFQKLLKKFYKETDFLAHSTSYEARTVQEFTDWLDNQSAKQVWQEEALEMCDNNYHYIKGDDPTICSCGKLVRR